MSTTSPNMSLIISTVGIDQGPNYALQLNQSLNLIDQHDHSPGKGSPISSEGITIVSDINMNGYAFTNLKSLTLTPQTSNTTPSTVFVKGVDLYYTDVNGSEIRITKDSGVNGTPGSINNLIAPAFVDYVPAQSTFVFGSNTNVAANLDIGSIKLRNLLPNSTFALTLQPPAGLSSNFSITLPTLPASTSIMSITNTGAITTGIKTPSLPASTKIVQLDSTGQLLSTLDVDDNTIKITTNQLVAQADKLQQSNIIINGGFDYWQYFTSNTITATGTVNSSFMLADRFISPYSKNSGPDYTLNADRTTDVPSAIAKDVSYSYKIASAGNTPLIGSGNFVIPFSQRIEGYYTLGISTTDTIYLSFYFKSNHTGTFPIRIRLVDEAGTGFRNYVTTFTYSVSEAWEQIQKSVVLPGFDFSRVNTLSMIVDIAATGGTTTTNLNTWTTEGSFNTAGTVEWTGVNGSAVNGYVQIAGVVLNNQAFQAFNRAGKTQINELALCQRYFAKAYGAASDTYSGAGGLAISTIIHPVPMRTTPTLADSTSIIDIGTTNGGTAINIDNTASYFRIDRQGSTLNMYALRLILMSAEL